MVGWHIGTMGFSYPDWRGTFYPQEMDSRRYLAHYSRIFNSVEIDSTFYGIPSRSTVRGWAAAVSPGFKISFKVPRTITHEAALFGVRPMFLEFVDAVQEIGENLGIILFQFPPSFQVDRLERLGEFLSEIPSGLKLAVEVRDRSWYTAGSEAPPLAEVLAEYQVCWAATEYPGLPGQIFPTSNFLYLRWIGQHGSFQVHDRERLDRTENLKVWLDNLEKQLPQTEDVYGYFNNDYAGFAAGTANRFKELAGLEVIDFSLPKQGVLF